MQSGASQLVLVVKNPSASAGGGKSCGFDPWVRKIPWKKAWQPTTVFWRQRSWQAAFHQVTKSWTRHD